jgi:hypothetical protein
VGDKNSRRNWANTIPKSPKLSSGDLDAKWQSADSGGEEIVGSGSITVQSPDLGEPAHSASMSLTRQPNQVRVALCSLTRARFSMAIPM